jgi:hypothetical protein
MNLQHQPLTAQCKETRQPPALGAACVHVLWRMPLLLHSVTNTFELYAVT